MTVATLIKKYIVGLPEGKSFSSNELRELGATANIRQALHRLVKTGLIKRIGRGIYVKPKRSQFVGETLPNAFQIAKVLSESTGETIAIQGAEAARMLHLTSQIPMRIIFYTSGNTRTIKLGQNYVKLKHVNPSRLIAAGTLPGMVISALNFVGRENVTVSTIKKIKKIISEKEFSETMKLVNRMPGWMADIFYHFNKENKNE